MLFDSEIITWSNLWLILKILSIPTILKLWIWFQSLRMYGVYKLYANREVIYNHEIFKELDRLYTDQELFNKISDNARREIFKDVFRVEISGLNEILISFRDYVYKEEEFLRFMRSHRKLDGRNLIDLFLRYYNAHRDKIGKKIKIKLKSSGLDNSRILYIIQKYYEFTEENSCGLRERLQFLRARTNMYYSIKDLLEYIEIEIQLRRIFLPEKFIKLNGKLNNITYKGYESYIETNGKIHVLPSEATQ